MSILNDCLDELADGDMTVSQLADELPHDRESIRKALARAADSPRPRPAHVVAWVNEQAGERTYPRQMYRAGDGPNKQRPARMDRATVVRRWSQRKAALVRASSVFNLGVAQRSVR